MPQSAACEVQLPSVLLNRSEILENVEQYVLPLFNIEAPDIKNYFFLVGDGRRGQGVARRVNDRRRPSPQFLNPPARVERVRRHDRIRIDRVWVIAPGSF